MKRVYLDHTATTPLDPSVLEAMKPYFAEKFGNASSIHAYGQEAKAALDESRDQIARTLGARGGEVFFVSCGTEADNAALKGAAFHMRRSHGKDHIVTSRIEHHAVLESCRYLEENGFRVTYLSPDGDGMIDPESVTRALTSKTCMVSIMHANNEVGTIAPIPEIARIARDREIVFHSDAVQSYGKIPLDLGEVNGAMLSLSAHKIYGPKGIGALVLPRGISIDRFVHGGGQERGRRAGTENVPLAVGFGAAAVMAQNSREGEAIRLRELREKFRSSLTSRLPAIIINGHPSESLPHIVNVSFDSSRIEIDGEALIFNLDLAGIAVTSGSACTSGSIEPSHVLLAMGRDPATARATVRFSMGKSTSSDDVEFAVEALERIVRRIGKRR